MKAKSLLGILGLAALASIGGCARQSSAVAASGCCETGTEIVAATCKPTGICNACSTCSSCKNCSQNGGSCSVCRGK